MRIHAPRCRWDSSAAAPRQAPWPWRPRPETAFPFPARDSAWAGAGKNWCPRPVRFRARRRGTSRGTRWSAPDGCAGRETFGIRAAMASLEIGDGLVVLQVVEVSRNPRSTSDVLAASGAAAASTARHAAVPATSALHYFYRNRLKRPARMLRHHGVVRRRQPLERRAELAGARSSPSPPPHCAGSPSSARASPACRGTSRGTRLPRCSASCSSGGANSARLELRPRPSPARAGSRDTRPGRCRSRTRGRPCPRAVPPASPRAARW